MVGREDIFKPTTGNESLHETSSDIGAREVNFATSENLSGAQYHHIAKLKKYAWTSLDWKNTHQIDRDLMDDKNNRRYLLV
jgi:hypothetical protein